MEQCSVLIVGAGPSGLALALSLAQHEIDVVILEKEVGVTDDPRGVFLAGDAVRILYQLGIGDEMDRIGHQVPTVNFHRSAFNTEPYLQLDTTADSLQQVVPEGILQIQPNLESALRRVVKASPFCVLREGCEVFNRTEIVDGNIVEYKTKDGPRRLQCRWLVGADGKKGVVRKHFLEKTAGIIQEPGLMAYEGCWVAANLKIRLPTPETHPDFPLWELGYTPEQVYDLFWPEGWHFCSPPGKPTAAGRFGPYEERFWRHEFAQPDWDNSMDAEAMLWEHLTPQVGRSRGIRGEYFDKTVTFPMDCVKVLRCRPFTFVQKVVNRWFHNRTVLIGDAAHVFPPFGGQGIACGVRDAHGLAWRLALLIKIPSLGVGPQTELLNSWAQERRQGVDDSTRSTMVSGSLCNEAETWTHYFARNLLWFAEQIPFLPRSDTLRSTVERQGYSRTSAGWFDSRYRGGHKLAQVYMRNTTGHLILSDTIFKKNPSTLTLVVMNTIDHCEVHQLRSVLQTAGLPPSLISDKSIIHVGPQTETNETRTTDAIYTIPDTSELNGSPVRNGYNAQSFEQSAGLSPRYLVIRPDFIMYAVAHDLNGLRTIFRSLRAKLVKTT